MSFVMSLKILFEYFLSVFIWSILNPYGLVQTLRQAAGQFIAISRSIVKDVMYDDTVTFVLPFEGTWKVVNGGIRKQTSHSWNIVGQRYAYDFVVVDDAGKTYRGSSNSPENYLAFGKPILAASDGVVVDVRNDIKDYHRAGTGWVDIKTPDIRGNYVVIKHDSGKYTLYAHLKAGSITVKKGEAVVTGQKIGECGHSGHSSEPHLHFQLQDRADFYTAIGLPIKFRNFERLENDTQECIELGYIEKDQMVHNVNTCCSGILETVDFIKPKISDLVWSTFVLFFTVLGIFVVVVRIIEFILNIL
jgi:hypothetical protein